MKSMNRDIFLHAYIPRSLSTGITECNLSIKLKGWDLENNYVVEIFIYKRDENDRIYFEIKLGKLLTDLLNAFECDNYHSWGNLFNFFITHHEMVLHHKNEHSILFGCGDIDNPKYLFKTVIGAIESLFSNMTINSSYSFGATQYMS